MAASLPVLCEPSCARSPKAPRSHRSGLWVRASSMLGARGARLRSHLQATTSYHMAVSPIGDAAVGGMIELAAQLLFIRAVLLGLALVDLEPQTWPCRQLDMP